MKPKPDYQLIAISCGGLLFNLIFWKEELGLNLVIYTMFTLASLLLLNRRLIQNRTWVLLSLVHLLTCIAVLFNHMPLSIMAYYISFFTMLGVGHYQQIKSVVVACFSLILQIIASPFTLFQKLSSLQVAGVSLKPIFKILRLTVIPVGLLFVFSLIYASANTVFASYLFGFFKQIEDAINWVAQHWFADLSFARFLFLILGLLFTGGMLLIFKANPVARMDEKYSEQLTRSKPRRRSLLSLFAAELGALPSPKRMGLKTENTVGILCFSVLNIILLILNLLEFTQLLDPNTMDYAANLHDGTNALIMSIVLAMIVILFFFNGNLNFYSKNKTIKNLTYLWILQNSVLVFAVIIKDYAYIEALGLTRKRIGVLVFALLCAIGLITILIKVKLQKTFYYLTKVNGLAWFIVLILSCSIHWDQQILYYNLAHRDHIPLDYEHATSLHNHTLITLYANRGLLAQTKIAQDPGSTKAENAYLHTREYLETRIERFMQDYETRSFLSWNYDDWRTYHYFKQRELTNAKP